VGLGRESGMPVGLQLIGKSFDESTLFQTGHLLEQALEPIGPPAGLSG
jgi:aspartyl-tRNA(Asn)/glutamyl-tRNA(Gln) amidotransferase subunit A